MSLDKFRKCRYSSVQELYTEVVIQLISLLSTSIFLLLFFFSRAKEATDLLVTEDEIVKIAQNIEMSLYKLYPDCGSRYKAKCKAICFNISDSKNLVRN